MTPSVTKLGANDHIGRLALGTELRVPTESVEEVGGDQDILQRCGLPNQKMTFYFCTYSVSGYISFHSNLHRRRVFIIYSMSQAIKGFIKAFSCRQCVFF